MRLHTSALDWHTLHDALVRAKTAGHIPSHVHIEHLAEYRSTKRSAGFEIRLGTYEKTKGDGRRWTNSGRRGANSDANYGTGLHAATWDEWGWFLAEVFDADPEAIVDRYDGQADFDATTKYKYLLGASVST